MFLIRHKDYWREGQGESTTSLNWVVLLNVDSKEGTRAAKLPETRNTDIQDRSILLSWKSQGRQSCACGVVANVLLPRIPELPAFIELFFSDIRLNEPVVTKGMDIMIIAIPANLLTMIAFPAWVRLVWELQKITCPQI